MQFPPNITDAEMTKLANALKAKLGINVGTSVAAGPMAGGAGSLNASPVGGCGAGSDAEIANMEAKEKIAEMEAKKEV